MFPDQPSPVSRLTDAQRLDWLRLIRSENIGPRTFKGLINRYGGAGAALAALPELARIHAGRKVVVATLDSCEREVELIERAGARLVALGEPDYPPLLRGIDAPPPLLTVLGAGAPHLNAGGASAPHVRPAVAIVGSRNASAAGLSFADLLARELGREGFVIVSGLARGIDARAHRAALPTGTIAVLAGGLGRIYPDEHAPLVEEIAARGGAVVTEMPFLWEPRGRDFPRRNRIVAGISYGTIVVEAARRSGSLITARFALEQAREVFAVPGSPLDPRAEGTNDLLREGATFCTSAADVVTALAPRVAGVSPPRPQLREDLFFGANTEPLWDETDIFGQSDVPLTSAGLELDDPGAPPLQAPQPAPRTNAISRARKNPSELLDEVTALLGPSPASVDDIVRATAASASEVQAALLDLDLAGRLERHGGGRVSLIG